MILTVLLLTRNPRIGEVLIAHAYLLLFLIPAAVPVGWNLLLSNHGTIHCWFTYRALAPALFSLLTALSLAAGRGEEREKRNG